MDMENKMCSLPYNVHWYIVPKITFFETIYFHNKLISIPVLRITISNVLANQPSPVTQWLEHLPQKWKVLGSSPD